jgi:hypothetical protein
MNRKGANDHRKQLPLQFEQMQIAFHSDLKPEHLREAYFGSRRTLIPTTFTP